MWNDRHERIKYVTGYKDEGRKSGVRLYTPSMGEKGPKKANDRNTTPGVLKGGIRRRVSGTKGRRKEELGAVIHQAWGRRDQKKAHDRNTTPGVSKAGIPLSSIKGRRKGERVERTSYGECLVHLDQLYLRISGCFEA